MGLTDVDLFLLDITLGPSTALAASTILGSGYEDVVGLIKAVQSRLGNSGRNNPTLATTLGGSVNTHSGWKFFSSYDIVSTDAIFDLAADIGYKFMPHPRDRGVEGRYFATHAEIKAAVLAPGQPIAVSNAICNSCIGFFSALAKHTGSVQIVADPYKTLIFLPSGRVLTR